MLVAAPDEGVVFGCIGNTILSGGLNARDGSVLARLVLETKLGGPVLLNDHHVGAQLAA